MNEKPVIIVTGKVPNMQSWYEEKCKRALEELAHLSDTIHRPGDTPNRGWATKEESDKAAQKGERARLYDFSTPVKDDVTLVAQWEKSKKWTITFDVNGGDTPAPADQQIFDGDHIVKPTDPTREGYIFQGWTTVKNDMLAKSVVSFDTTTDESLMPVDRDGVLYALWSQSSSSAFSAIH